MSEQEANIQDAADRVIELEAELEAAGNALSADEVERARNILRDWIDHAVAIVATPALGRVTLIGKDGRYSTIASPDLAYLVTGPMKGSYPIMDD